MYEYRGRIRYSECDGVGRLSMSGLINYLQDVATQHSHDIGVGLFWLMERDMGWVVTNYALEIGEMPKMGDEIIIRTYPHTMKGCVANRAFEVLYTNGDRIAVANSTWAIMNVKEFKPLRISEEMLSAYAPLEKPDFTPEPEKIKVNPETEPVGRFVVTMGELDTNNHMNNGAYVTVSDKFLPEGEKYRFCNYVYKKMLFLDDEVEVYRETDDMGRLNIVFRSGGEINFIAQYKK